MNSYRLFPQFQPKGGSLPSVSLFTWQGALARRSSTALLSHKAKAPGTARNSTSAASGGGWNQHEGLRGDEVTARASQEPVARSCA